MDYTGPDLAILRDSAVYFPNEELRDATRQAVTVVMIAPHRDVVAPDAWREQHFALQALRRVLGAYARGDQLLPAKDLDWLARQSDLHIIKASPE
ncbi:hypothetical protein [Microbacterium sp. CH1]|uniref:hypothetical protein n=1 Tax=Microbacterium sp. CH1 TaxID=1770208 RepID=UPI0012FC4022|nr:hypothetical protein [Microbacterium sp. CH1]